MFNLAYNKRSLEDSRGRKSKDRQYNGKTKRDKWTNNDLQNTKQS